MTLLSGGETVRENASEVFRRDSDAVVGHLKTDELRGRLFDLNPNLAVAGGVVADGILGVLQEVYADLQRLLFVDDVNRGEDKIGFDLDLMMRVGHLVDS